MIHGRMVKYLMLTLCKCGICKLQLFFSLNYKKAMSTFDLDSKGFVCEYKKRSAWFGSFEIRYIVIEEERMKVFKNEKDYVSSKHKNSKPSMTIVLRNARLKVSSEQCKSGAHTTVSHS